MFSEEKEHERRAANGQKDGSKQSFIRHRIPYRLLGRRSLGAKRLVVSSKVLLPAIPTQNCDVVLTFPASTEDATLMWLLARLRSRSPALTVHVRHHSHTGIYGFYLTALYESLLQGAEELAILKPLKSDYGGGMKEFVCEDQDCFAGVEDEASFLTSHERQSIVLHFLHELRATGDDCLEGITFIEGQPIVPLLITKKVISQVFPLHNHADLKLLNQTWVQAIFSRQPLDEVSRYFGVKIALYFAYLGHYTTWLIIPALVGLVIFLLQGDSQWHEDVCYVGFALFNTVWTTLYIKFWKRRSTEFCYRWGTLEQKDDMLKDPRPLFKGDLVKSPITGRLELAYSSWKRLLFRYFITFPIIAVCLVFVFIVMLLCFELQEWVNELITEEELPYLFSFVPKVLLAIVVSIFDEIYKQIAIWLTHKENYRLQESHETSLVIKLVLFQFVNSFLSLFYIGFYLRDMNRLRDQLAALLITRQVLGNIKEALLPYVIWKARLYRIGLRIATRMSPASVEKEVRRMTTRSSSQASRSPAKGQASSSKSKVLGDAGKNSDSENSPVTEEDEERLPTLTQAEVESAMKTYEDTLDDYLEMCIQFGYITLFSSAFPLAAVCALLNNVIEIRSDAFKLCVTFQRPFGHRVESIGIWQDVLLVISVIAVIINCALVATSGLLVRVCPGLSSSIYCLIIVIIEHLILMGKFGLYCSIPDLPPIVAMEMARLEYQRSEALKQLVSQSTPNPAGGSALSSYSNSPIMRRRRLDSPSSEFSGREAPPLNVPSSASRNGSSFSTVITSSNLAPRPSDISAEATHTKPGVPPRSSVQRSEYMRPLVSSAYSDVAEKVVTAALNPIIDSHGSRNSAPLSAVGVQEIPYSVPTESGLHEIIESSEAPKRFPRNRFDLGTWRRLSEPVPSAIIQAVSLHVDESDDAKLKKKSIYENKEDLRDSLQDDLRRSRERLSLRQELISSKDRLNILGNISKVNSRTVDEPIVRSSSTPRISTTLACLPPTAPGVLAKSTMAAKYSASPRFMRGVIGDSKSMSKTIRSLSSADVSEIRQVFKDRFSVRGQPALSRSASLESNQTAVVTGNQRDAKQTMDTKRLQRSTSTKGADGNIKPERLNNGQPLPDRNNTAKSTDEVIRKAANTEDTSLSQAVSQKIESRDPAKSEDQRKINILNRAIRGSATQPLSVLSNIDSKEKKPS